MTKLRRLALIVVATHWIVAVWHLFAAARILPAPDNHVSAQAIIFITLGHFVVSTALWKLSEKPGGWVSLIFFVAAMSADLYEHFLHASLNNVFMVAFSYWAGWFDVSVAFLLALEILGCCLGILLLGRQRHPAAT